MGLLAVLIVLCLIGFFVAAKRVVVTVRRTNLQQSVPAGDAHAGHVVRLIDHLNPSIADSPLPLASPGLLERALAFSQLAVRQVMVPRTEMTAIPLDARLDDVLCIASTGSHLRLPVYERDLDHIVGVLDFKHLLPLLATNPARPAVFDVRAAMVEPLFVPESVPATDVLARLRAARTQLAVIIDEYGGTAGITTLEDLAERVVGTITDELAAPAPGAELPDGSYVLAGLTSLQNAKDEHDLDLSGPSYDVETVGGYVFAALGRQPLIGDEVQTPHGDTLRIEALDRLRVERVRVLPAPGKDPAANAVRVVTLNNPDVAVSTASTRAGRMGSANSARVMNVRDNL